MGWLEWAKDFLWTEFVAFGFRHLAWGGVVMICAILFGRRYRKRMQDLENKVEDLQQRPPITIEQRFDKMRGVPTPYPLLHASAAPEPGTWISCNEALHTIGASSLVRIRLPRETITGLDLIARRMGSTWKAPWEKMADELSRNLLRDFASQHPKAVSNEKYGKEPLEWWIDKEADRRL